MKKNRRKQFDVVFDSESNGGIFDSLAPFGGDLWRFENLKFVRHLQSTQNIFEEFFYPNRVKNSKCTGQIFIDFHFYNDLE